MNIYESTKEDYYSKQLNNPTITTFWFKNRQLITQKLVNKYSYGELVLDLGCGNCLWKPAQTPAVGVDLCEGMLRYNAREQSLFFPLKADISSILPFKDESVNTIVITEVLEHIEGVASLVKEMHRVLRSSGIIIISVPYASLPGVWGLVFPLWCKYKFLVKKDIYYKNRCGHIRDFTPCDIKGIFREFDLLERINLCFLTLFFVFRKS